jgi:hypothetical protein
MPKTISTTDPHLLTAVNRLGRTQMVWGWLLIGFGLLTQLYARLDHPVAGLPFVAIGVACLRWGDPALLAAVATLVALSIVPAVNGRAAILGPEPFVRMLGMSAIEIGALVVGKLLVVITATNQFVFYRLLYGTARATSDDPDLPIVPEMVPNRTDRLARWGSGLALGGVAACVVSLLLRLFDPAAFATRVTAEIGGSLGATAIGLGLGAAFSPTNERPAALWSTALGALSYFVAAFALLRLP